MYVIYMQTIYIFAAVNHACIKEPPCIIFVVYICVYVHLYGSGCLSQLPSIFWEIYECGLASKLVTCSCLGSVRLWYNADITLKGWAVCIAIERMISLKDPCLFDYMPHEYKPPLIERNYIAIVFKAVLHAVVLLLLYHFEYIPCYMGRIL